jgi:hypothetical protein
MPLKLTLRPTVKQDKVYNYLLRNKEVQFVFFGGGSGGGKSWLLCEWQLLMAIMYPGHKGFLGREELKRLMSSTYLTFLKVCQHHGIPSDAYKLNGQYNYIEFVNGSRIDLLDLKALPGDPMYERFGSLEFTDGAIDEVGEIDFLAFDVLKSRVGRHKNKEWDLQPKLACSLNPKKNWVYSTVYKPWKSGTLDPRYAFVQSLYKDNPYTAESYGQSLAAMKDNAMRERLMFGNWEYDDDPARLIPYEAINDLWTNAVEKDDERYLTADIARYGSDKTVIMVWQGFEVILVQSWEHKGIDETAELIRNLSIQFNVPYSRIIVDSDGLGGGVMDILRGIKGFVANAQPFLRKDGRPSNYQNMKTQCQYALAEAINARKLAVRTPDIKVREAISEELDYIRTRDADKDGKLKLMPKDEIKELLGRSPDYVDALTFRMYFDLKSPVREIKESVDPDVREHFRARAGAGSLRNAL